MGLFSKIAHIPIIEEIAKGMKAAGMNGAYLELGIAKGACFNKVAPHFKKYTAVDINLDCYDRVCQIMRRKGACFHEGTTDDYFENGNKGQKFDMIFIDACHKFENVRSDFINSWHVLNNNGLIICHDTYPPNKEYIDHCEDAWKMSGYIRAGNVAISPHSTEIFYPGSNLCDVITLPFFFGLTIVRKYKKHLAWMK